MILQVHDELNFSVVPNEKEQVEKIVLEEMQNAFKLKVPLIADAGWGANWLEAHWNTPSTQRGKRQKWGVFFNREVLYKEKDAMPQQEKGASFKVEQDAW